MNLWRWIGGGCVVLGVLVGTMIRGWPGLGAAATLLVLGGWGLLYEPRNVAVRLAGLAWTMRDFGRGWLVSGDIGSGKTSSGIVQLMRQLFLNVPTWGGLCIDEKGVFWETLTQMAAHHDRAEDVLVLEVRPEGDAENWQPKHRFNLVGDRSIPNSTYAHMVIDAAQSLGQKNDQGFFREQAELHIANALEALEVLGYDVTLENVCQLLTQESELSKAVVHLRQVTTPSALRLADHFEQQLLRAPFEQRSGVTSTVLNYLRHFIEPDIAEVFCRDSTFRLDDLDEGKIACLLMPHRHQSARRYVGVFLKGLVYLHVLRRYNLPAEERGRKNLLVIWIDEAQRFVTTSRNHGEASVVDLVREANCAVVLATQSITSLVAVLGRDTARVLALNLRNRMGFKSADQEDAEEVAGRLGKRKKSKVSFSYGRGGRQRTETKEDEFIVPPNELRQLRPHQCLLLHCRGAHRRWFLPPLLPDGRVAPWFRRWWWF